MQLYYIPASYLQFALWGKRQISELQTSELVVTLLISDIAAIPMQDAAQPLVSGIVPIAVLVIAEIAVSALMVKHSGFRKAVCGSPIILINNGKVDQNKCAGYVLPLKIYLNNYGKRYFFFAGCCICHYGNKRKNQCN